MADATESLTLIRPEEAKAALVAEVREADGDLAAEMAEALLGDVAGLFTFLESPDLPDAMKARLSQLFEPVGRLALVDAEVTSNPDHPARYLLTDMLRLLRDDSIPVDDEEAVRKKVGSVVARVIRDYDRNDDLRPFESGLAELERFRKRHVRRAALAEKRSAHAARAKKRLQEARELATAAVERLFEHHSVVPAIAEFISGPWHNVLTLTCLREGPDSEQMVTMLRYSRELATHAGGKPFHESTSAGVIDALAMVGLSRSEAGRSLKNLARKRPQKTALPSRKPGKERAQEAEEPAVVESRPAEPQRKSTRESIAERLEPGQWMEFLREDGKRIAAKLSWRSPISRKLLFVNDQGIKIADRTEDEIVTDVLRGEAVLVERV